MREPIIESLSRFTPDGSGLDRDAIMYAAGRTSARPNRGWMALAGSLAACQVVTLALLWPRPNSTVDSHDVPSFVKQESESIPSMAIKQNSQGKSDAAELWALNRQMLMNRGIDLPPADTSAGPMVPSDPPLHAYSTAAFVALD